jgi:4-hydroxybenzoate polyprenyltransferase
MSVDKISLPMAALQAMRIPHWGKNLLLFVPVLTAHQLEQIDTLVIALLAFLAFSLCASSGYILNDLLDREADRAHSRKSERLIASGVISPAQAVTIFVVLLMGGIAVASLLTPAFWAVLAFYYALTLVYSLFLKRLLIIDVVVLGMLFTVRIYAGSAATGIELSFWLLLFSFFIFLSLAIVKRYSDLVCEPNLEEGGLPGRAYRASDTIPLLCLGVGASIVSVLVMALYVNSEHFLTMYTRPMFIWMICPLLMYWTMRIWILASRGVVRDDPVLFALKDKTSYIVLAFMIVLMLLGR